LSKRTKIIIAVAAGLLAAIIAMGYLRARERQLIEMAQPINVATATRNIPQGTVIAEGDITLAEIPIRFVQPGFITDLRDVVDRVALVGILEGEQITASKIVSGEVEPLANMLPAGQRGVTLEVTPVSGVGGLIQPGDYVDVVGVFELGRRAEEIQTQARFLLQSILVAAVDQYTGQVPQVQVEGEVLGGQAATLATTVTLACEPEDAQTIVLAQTVGEVYLLLRSRRDSNEQLAFEVLDPQKMLGTDLPIWSPALEEADFQQQLLEGLR
jgi:pilus assembly protein CpaB